MAPQGDPPQLSVVVPFRNEAASLPRLYRELDAVLAELPIRAELIFVDDASSDGSAAALRSAGGGDPRLRLLTLSPHSGQSAALEAGFEAARGEWIATLDADGQNDPADLPKLLSRMPQTDCVCGIRMGRQDRLAKRWASRIANRLRRRVLGDFIEDIGCSLRVMRRAPLRRVKMFRGAHRFLPALLAMEGARIEQLPVSHRPRQHGESKYAIRDRLSATWLDLLAVRWMQHRQHRYEAKELARPEKRAQRETTPNRNA